MENNAAFHYEYSAKENAEVQEIRNKYLPQPDSKLDALKKLDTKVKQPVNVFAYVFGSVSAIVMGAGMSLVMTDIGAIIGIEEAMVPGIIVGIVGMAMAIITYPIYKRMLASRKKKYADKIIALSDQIISE